MGASPPRGSAAFTYSQAAAAAFYTMLQSPELNYPSAAEAALECASYMLESSDERSDLIENLQSNYVCDSLAAWESVIRDYFRATSHIYCAAFIACAESEAEIDAEIRALATELYENRCL